jgi:superfamily II DNA helicase RecQ
MSVSFNIKGQRNNLRQVVAFAENKIECRRQQVLRYFSESFDKRNCEKTCDNCSSILDYTVVDITADVKILVKLVKSIQQSHVTIAHCIDVYRGSQNAKVMGSMHNELPEYGLGKAYIKADVDRIFHQMITMEILKETCERNVHGGIIAYVFLGKNAFGHGKVEFSFIKVWKGTNL